MRRFIRIIFMGMLIAVSGCADSAKEVGHGQNSVSKLDGVLSQGVSKTLSIQMAKESLEELFAEHPGFDKDIEGTFSGNPQEIGRRVGKIFSFVIPQRLLGKSQAAAHELEMITKTKAQADAGDADAQLRLGIVYLTETGTQQDIKQGVDMLERAVAGGDYRAMYGLARMYESGVAVSVDKHKAAEFYRRLASIQEWRMVKNRIGAMYEEGMDVPQDFEKAMHWYKDAAEPVGKYMPGIAKSKYNVGRLYVQGKGVQTDYWEAAKWFIDAADYINDGQNAYPTAQCALAILYLAGLGVQKDEPQAEYWLAKPGALRAQVCVRIIKERGITTTVSGTRQPVPVFPAAAGEPPHLVGPYPFSADELLGKLLEVAKLPDGYVTKEQVEKIFGFTFPPDSAHTVNRPGTNDGVGKPLAYTTEAGKDWYFQVNSYNPSANESVFAFRWGDLRHEKVGVMHAPPPGMCIAAEKVMPELEKIGWVLEQKHQLNLYGDRNIYRKGRYGDLLLSVDDFNRENNCILEFYISRLIRP